MKYLVIMGKSQLVFHHLNGQNIVKKWGAGEILITSIDRDGFLNGFDLELCKRIIKFCQTTCFSFRRLWKLATYVRCI